MLKTRFTYTLALYGLLPLLPLRLLKRALKQRAYLSHIPERFGFFGDSASMPVIWLHAVSLGETRAAVPLVKRIAAEYPHHQILISHMTPTGRRASQELFGDRVLRCYLPYDFPFAVRRFLKHFRPRLGLIMETEIWPNLIHACRRRNIPVALVNGRLSEKSFRRYARYLGVVGSALTSLYGIAAQSAEDRKRFAELGAQRIEVCGSIKFDVAVPEPMLQLGNAFRDNYGHPRFVWVAASTRDGEEALVLDAFEAANIANALLVIVPRHPERFGEVEKLIRQRGFALQRRSDNAPIAGTTRLVLGDSMGELFAYYQASDVAFIGGSLLPYGGQNLIEACAVGKPVLIGPHTYNFEETTRLAIDAGAAIRVADARELARTLAQLEHDKEKRTRMSEAALSFSSASRGALERVWAFLRPVLPPGPGA